MAEELINLPTGKAVETLFKRKMVEVTRALGAEVSANRLARFTIMAIAENEKLQQCTPLSLFRAACGLGFIGLEPNTAAGHAWLVPFRDNETGTTVVQVLIGYRGLIQLAFRHENCLDVYTEVVCENDDFSYQLGTDKKIHHVPVLDVDRGKPKYVYAVYKSVRGASDFLVMSIRDTEKIRRASKSPNSPAWKYWPEEMQQKCPLRRLLKRKPMSYEIALPIAKDDEGSGVLGRKEIDDIIETTGISLPVEEESSPTLPTPSPPTSEPARTETTEDPPKKKRGRPKGSKNKPKEPEAPPAETPQEFKEPAALEPGHPEPEEPPAPPKPKPEPADALERVLQEFQDAKTEPPEDSDELLALQGLPAWALKVCAQGVSVKDFTECMWAKGHLGPKQELKEMPALWAQRCDENPKGAAIAVKNWLGEGSPAQE